MSQATKPCPYRGFQIEWHGPAGIVNATISKCLYEDRWRRFLISTNSGAPRGPAGVTVEIRTSNGVSNPHGNDAYKIWHDLNGTTLDSLRESCDVCHGGP
jgi:hypothetical protein